VFEATPPPAKFYNLTAAPDRYRMLVFSKKDLQVALERRKDQAMIMKLGKEAQAEERV